MSIFARSFALFMIVCTTLLTTAATVTYPGLFGVDNLLSLGSGLVAVALFVFGRQFAAQSQRRWTLVIVTVMVSLYEFVHTLSALTVILAVLIVFAAIALGALFGDKVDTESLKAKFFQPADAWDNTVVPQRISFFEEPNHDYVS